MSINPTKGYSISEAVKITGKHRNTIRNYINCGILKAYESRRNIKSKDGQPQKALLIKGKELITYLNTY